ncbi:MAG TPA: inorganic diphosphatase [Candidatus Aphodomonas merdavium]|nr:inorganic diphosphatase [Candidatus Aphodomonas merdavium]
MHIVEARIEIPMGSQNKYEIDHETGKIKLNRVLYSAAFYPVEYGFIENTLSEDGDPLDILVMTSSPTFPGCYIDARILGGIDMVDTGAKDTKILAVNVGDPRYEHMRTLDDVPPHFIRELENFFSTYKEMQHKKTEVRGFFGEEEAVKQLEKAYARYRERYL